MLQGTFETASHEPAVERVVAVLDENGSLRETEECAACIPKLGGSDQHRTVDVMALLRVRVDRRAAIDEGVEEGERPGQLESLGAKLEDEERGVASRLDIDGDELGIVQQRLRTELRRVDGDLLPGDGLRSPAGLEEDRLHGCRQSAARRNWISSRVIARRSTTAAA
jgi:hypothetical protein